MPPPDIPLLHLVWTLCIGKSIPSLLTWKCQSEATAWRVTTPPPWNINLCSLSHPTLRLFSFFDSTTLTLGLSRTPLWMAMLMKRSQEILLNITFQLLCHKCWSRGKCPSDPLLANQLLSHALSSVLTKVGIPMLLELKASLAPVCILKVWELPTPQQFQIFLVIRMKFSGSHKTHKIIKAKKGGFESYFEGFYLSQQHAIIWRPFTVLQFLRDY